MKLKGIENIENILNKFLESFECTAELGSDFSYWYSDSLINFALVVSKSNDIDFRDFCKELQPQLHCDIFLLSFMHELGHHETVDEWEDEEYLDMKIQKEKINKMKVSQKEKNFMYFNIPDEKRATEWGLKYIMAHQTEIMQLWNEIQQAILLVYKLNDIH